ncbi:hypothetical protein JOQ06_029356 [Pogonophryne albipinna]|uniref:Integrin alpha second immunoglobulin-like domain-containing protein n=1 Tax=Pogonophryne albipinna TaxID=1090488 RepID=A0AAD6B8A1_9TELE|nr:hypothetical protein JOQ06_029356 [Pogonophryne albipinna]
MIFSGSRGGVSSEPRQVIQGSSVSPGFRTFGYSLSGGQDVDGNRYPDLLVGSLDNQVALLRYPDLLVGSLDNQVALLRYPDLLGGSLDNQVALLRYPDLLGGSLDDQVALLRYPDLLVGSLDNQVALLRTRPVLHLNKTIRVSPDVVDPNNCDFCIQVEVCFSYMFSTGERSHRDNISLQSPVRNKVEPLMFSLNASLHEKLPRKRNAVQDLKRLPVLSETPRPIRTQIHIQKACGSDNRCSSNLQMKAQFTDQNQNPYTRQQHSQVLLYDSSLSLLFLEVNVSNMEAEDAHRAALSISFTSPTLSYSGVRSKVRGVNRPLTGVCVAGETDQVLLCELGNPFRSNHQIQVLIIFQTSEISLNTREIQTVLQLSTLSEQDDLLPVCISMLVQFSLQTSLSL